MSNSQKTKLLDLIDYTIIPAIYEDLGVVDEDGVNEALVFLANNLVNKTQE